MKALSLQKIVDYLVAVAVDVVRDVNPVHTCFIMLPDELVERQVVFYVGEPHFADGLVGYGDVGCLTFDVLAGAYSTHGSVQSWRTIPAADAYGSHLVAQWLEHMHCKVGEVDDLRLSRFVPDALCFGGVAGAKFFESEVVTQFYHLSLFFDY